jgi:hypothetical protein
MRPFTPPVGHRRNCPPLEDFLVERRIDVALLIRLIVDTCGPRAQGRQNGGRAAAGPDVAVAGAAAGGRGR